LITQAVRGQQIRSALDAHDAAREPTIQMVWKGQARIFPQVRLGLEYPLLNPRSHRIRAQLESDEQAELIRNDPFSDEGQQAIARLLRETEGFERLKTNLGEEGQRDPGIMTSAGVLVNANTRAVALRDLGIQHIDVVVLPEDATQQEIDELELRLQMQQELRQDYTFTNELLFVEDLISTYGFSAEEVAKALRWATSSEPGELRRGRERVEQSTRMLSIIRDIQSISGGAIKLTFFDDKRQSLIEIDQQYQRLRGRNPAAALAVRNARTLGLLTDRLGYQPLRMIDENFVGSYLEPALLENEVLSEVVPALSEEGEGESPEGVDVLTGNGDGDGVGDGLLDVSPLVAALARSEGSETVDLPTGKGDAKLQRTQVLEAVTDALQSAVEEARLDTRRGTRLERPRQLLVEAESKLRRAVDTYEEVKDEPDFDLEAFRDEFERVQRRVEAFRQKT
jgi:hypothetical protein